MSEMLTHKEASRLVRTYRRKLWFSMDLLAFKMSYLFNRTLPTTTLRAVVGGSHPLSMEWLAAIVGIITERPWTVAENSDGEQVLVPDHEQSIEK